MATLVPPKQLSSSSMPEAENPPAEVIVFICPTPGCGDYYAATDFRPDRIDLTTPQTRRNQSSGAQETSHPRLECPLCRANGKKVNRVGYIVTGVINLSKAVEAFKKDTEDRAKKKARREGAEGGGR